MAIIEDVEERIGIRAFLYVERGLCVWCGEREAGCVSGWLKIIRNGSEGVVKLGWLP